MSVLLKVVDAKGSAAGEVELQEAWLERSKGQQAVHDTVRAYLAAQRAGTARVKNRARVRGGGAKPWRQKGTGRARAGTRSSPLWRGGGVIFGPAGANFKKKVNKKVRRLALKRAFTERVDENAVIVVDELILDEPKTRKLTAVLAAVEAGGSALLVVDKATEALKLAARNLPKVEVLEANVLNAYEVLYFDKIVIAKAALEALGARLA